jgi:hypothetical protein
MQNFTRIPDARQAAHITRISTGPMSNSLRGARRVVSYDGDLM